MQNRSKAKFAILFEAADGYRRVQIFDYDIGLTDILWEYNSYFYSNLHSTLLLALSLSLGSLTKYANYYLYYIGYQTCIPLLLELNKIYVFVHMYLKF